MATRYFEFVGEDARRQDRVASKFWEVTVDGSTVTVRYGKIGTNGQTSVKELASAAEADAQAAKVIGEKTKKGYTEIVS